mmetsp:Transcript_86665/g.223210  ORF Transcript_86665/g.223210 Transcript_86665/m.223210 type:complete len:247 (-) Transcript_86665:132-872(-)
MSQLGTPRNRAATLPFFLMMITNSAVASSSPWLTAWAIWPSMSSDQFATSSVPVASSGGMATYVRFRAAAASADLSDAGPFSTGTISRSARSKASAREAAVLRTSSRYVLLPMHSTGRRERWRRSCRRSESFTNSSSPWPLLSHTTRRDSSAPSSFATSRLVDTSFSNQVRNAKRTKEPRLMATSCSTLPVGAADLMPESDAARRGSVKRRPTSVEMVKKPKKAKRTLPKGSSVSARSFDRLKGFG